MECKLLTSANNFSYSSLIKIYPEWNVNISEMIEILILWVIKIYPEWNVNDFANPP